MTREQLSTVKGRIVPAQNLHITLAFLGDVDAEQRLCAEQVASRIKGDQFSMQMERVGHWRRPQVVWLGPKETPEALQELAAQLNQGLVKCGFPVEKRAFKAHMTLMRRASRSPGRVMFDSIGWKVDRFVLVKSNLTPKGAQYEVVEEWSLASVS